VLITFLPIVKTSYASYYHIVVLCTGQLRSVEGYFKKKKDLLKPVVMWNGILDNTFNSFSQMNSISLNLKVKLCQQASTYPERSTIVVGLPCGG
jgi:hypothetical protein